MNPRERAEMWRERAASLDAFAARCRLDGANDVALQAERAALDYRVAAEQLELEAEVQQ